MGIKSHIKINLIDDSVLDYLLECIFINNKKFEQMAEEYMEIIVENVKKIIIDKSLTSDEKIERIKEVLMQNGVDLEC
ncbi:MAG: hypothetical protein E7404_02680 [Ruminococcaceae bacterium]|nr:hypothetical protein [Oscillospiraceae bacterium]